MFKRNTQLKATSPLAEWLYYLENSHSKVIDLGLERIRRVADELDLRTPAPFVITVGGTNGKGTTCRLLETLLINHGLRVGVYSSPHLLRYNERVRVQGEELPDAAHCASFAFIENARSESLSYFEFSTLSALHLFTQAKLDVVILEVGLGGRLDATNIVDSDIAVITSIDIDHTDFLGDSREQIAFEKAGIFRAGKPVVIGEPDVPQSMLAQAEQLQCMVFRRDKDWMFESGQKSWLWHCADTQWANLPLCRIPLANAATALAVVHQLPFAITPQNIRKSLQDVELTGRFQSLNDAQRHRLSVNLGCALASLPELILDVGHNPHAAGFLAEKLAGLKDQGKIIAVCGMLKDKDAEAVFTRLQGLIEQWICVTLQGPRGQTADELQAKLYSTQPNAKSQLADSVAEGVERAIAQATPQDKVLVFGSFHTVGEFLQML